MNQTRAMRTMNTEQRKDGKRTLWKNLEKDDAKPLERKYGILKTLHDAALDKASEARRPGGKHAERPTLSEDQMIEMRLRGQTEEAAREIAFQAREQIDFLNDVQNRVQHALKNSDEILNDEDPNATTDELKGKRWVDHSRRMINGAVFRYHESCEERHEQLSAFCDWFELYENIWPLPLVQNDLQYNELLGKDDNLDLDQDEDVAMEKISALWPKMAKMREDLGHIMSVTSEMGQKALNAELREQLTRQANKIKELDDMIEILQKALEAERKLVQEQINEMAKMRNMHEVAINRRNEEIKQLKEQMEQMQLDHEAQVERLQEKFDNMVEEFEAKIREMQDDHQRVVKDFEAQIAGLQENIAELEATIVEKDNEIDIRDQSIEALTQNMDRLTKEHEVIKVQLGQVMDELRTERENPYVKRLETKNAEMMRSIASLEEQLEDAQSKNALLEAKVEAQGSELSTLTEEKKKVDYEYKQQTVAYEAAQEELVRLRRENAGQAQAMQQLNERLVHADEVLQKEKERLGFLIDDEQKKGRQLQAELDQVSKDKADVEKKIKFLSHDFEEKEAKLQEKARTFELKARASEKKRKTEVAALEAEKKGLQQDLVTKQEEYATALDEQSTKYEAALEAQTSELDGLRDFKAFYDAKDYVDLHTQTDLANDSAGPALGPSSVVARRAGGEDEGGEEIFFSRAQRIMKKFKTLREKVVEVRVGFEGETQILKQVMAESLKQQAFKRDEVLKETARVAEALARVGDIAAKNQWLTTADGVPEGGGNELVAGLCEAVEELQRLAQGLVAQDQVQQQLQDKGRDKLLDGIPDTIVDLEHILEGVESCLSMSVHRPASASSTGSRPSSATVQNNLRPLLAMAQARVEAQLAETTMDFSRLSLAEHNRLRATIQIMGPPANTLERIALEQLQDGGRTGRRFSQEDHVSRVPSDGSAAAAGGVEAQRSREQRSAASPVSRPAAAKDLLRMQGTRFGHETSPRHSSREGLVDAQDAADLTSTGPAAQQADVTKYLTSTRHGSPPPQRNIYTSRRQPVGVRDPPLSPAGRPGVQPVVGLPFAGAPKLDTSNMRGRRPERLTPEAPPSMEFDDKVVVSQPSTPEGAGLISAAGFLQMAGRSLSPGSREGRSLSPAAKEAAEQELKFRDPSRMASLVVAGHHVHSPSRHPRVGSPDPHHSADAEIAAAMGGQDPSAGEARGLSESPDPGHTDVSRPGTVLSGQATKPRPTTTPERGFFPGSTLQGRRVDTAGDEESANRAVYHVSKHKDGAQRPHSVEPELLMGRPAHHEAFLPSPGQPSLSPQRQGSSRQIPPPLSNLKFAEDFRASRHQLEKVAEIDAETAKERALQAAEKESRWAPEERRQQALRRRAAGAGEVTDLSGQVLLEDRITRVPSAGRRGSLGGGRRGSMRTATPPAHLVHSAQPSGSPAKRGPETGTLSPLKGKMLVAPSRDGYPPAKSMPLLATAFDPSKRALPPSKVVRAVTPARDDVWAEDGRRTPERPRPPSASWGADLVTEHALAPDAFPAIASAGAASRGRAAREPALGETLQVQRLSLDRQS